MKYLVILVSLSLSMAVSAQTGSNSYQQNKSALDKATFEYVATSASVNRVEVPLKGQNTLVVNGDAVAMNLNTNTENIESKSTVSNYQFRADDTNKLLYMSLQSDGYYVSLKVKPNGEAMLMLQSKDRTMNYLGYLK